MYLFFKKKLHFATDAAHATNATDAADTEYYTATATGYCFKHPESHGNAATKSCIRSKPAAYADGSSDCWNDDRCCCGSTGQHWPIRVRQGRQVERQRVTR